MAKKAAQRRANRRARRDFAEVAVDAVSEAYANGEIDHVKAQELTQALRRPRGVETIRAAFSEDAGPEQLKLGEILTGPDKGKIDFGKLFDLLTGFFPKLANSKAGRLFKVFQRIRDIVKEPA